MTPHTIASSVRHFRPLRRIAAVAASLCCLAVPGLAQAQARLDADYVARLAGLTIGKGSWTIQLNGENYASLASGGTSGILKAFSSGSSTTTGRGKLDGDQIVAGTYQSTLDISKKSDVINIEIANGNVKSAAINPEPPADSERVAVTDAMKRGVKDPIAATMLRARWKGDLVSDEACKSAVSVFDGRMRYDVALTFRRIDRVKAEQGYEGPAVVCGLTFTPLGGHNPNRKAIRYMAAQRDIDVWLVPIAGTRVLVPFRVTSPTPVGEAVVEARRFVVSPLTIPAGMRAP